MNKKKKKEVTILIAIVVTIAISVVITIFVNKKITTDTNNKVVNSVLSNAEKENAINELDKYVKDETNQGCIVVNEEKISEKEIALVDFQINNQYVNKTEEKKDAKAETIKEHIILQDAEKNKIALTEQEKENIEKQVQSFLKKDDEETNKLLQAFQMEYEEFLEFYTTRTKNLEIISKWKLAMVDEIMQGKIQLDSKEFKEKYKEYTNCKETSKQLKLIFELVDIYIEYLQKQATIKYLD